MAVRRRRTGDVLFFTAVGLRATHQRCRQFGRCLNIPSSIRYFTVQPRCSPLLQQIRKSCNSESAYVDFHKSWVLTGLAKVRGGRICTLILANWRNPRPTDPLRPLLVFATDGSGQGGQAGWGLTSVRTTQGSMQADTDAEFDLEAAVREECGRVVTNPNQAEHLGGRSDTSDQQHRRAQRGLPRADERARAGAAR